MLVLMHRFPRPVSSFPSSTLWVELSWAHDRTALADCFIYNTKSAAHKRFDYIQDDTNIKSKPSQSHFHVIIRSKPVVYWISLSISRCHHLNGLMRQWNKGKVGQVIVICCIDTIRKLKAVVRVWRPYYIAIINARVQQVLIYRLMSNLSPPKIGIVSIRMRDQSAEVNGLRVDG